VSGLRLVFLGTPEFAVPSLRALAASRHSLVGAISQPDRPRGRGRKLEPTPVRRAAEGLGVECLQPESIGDAAAGAWLAERAPDLGVVVAFGQFVPKAVRELPRRGMINAHASLLPRWRGAAPIEHAILAGDAHTGISIMRLVREMDAGDVCLRRETPIGPDETAGELAERLAQLAAGALVEAVDRIDAGSARFEPQPAEGITLAPKLDRGFGELDLSAPLERVYARVRAATPRPGIDLRLARADKTLRIVRCAPWTGACAPRPGAVCADGGRLRVSAADGWLELLRVQLPGRQAVDAAEFLRGARLEPGEQVVRR
jgi:methionyl-tRNA formyltransferase